MSSIQQHEENGKRSGNTPLARFLHKGQFDDDVKPGTSETPDKPECGSECGSGSKARQESKSFTSFATFSKPKSEYSQRPRKSSHKRSNSKSNENNALPRVDGYCRCGIKAEAPYFERCEDCFAEDSERWNGRDQSATIYW